MNHEQAHGLIDAYIDDELDLVKSLELEEHLRNCGECLRELNNLRALRSAFGQPSMYHEAPAALRKRVVGSLKAEMKEEKTFSLKGWKWRLIGFGAAFAALALWVVFSLVQNPSADNLLAQELVSSHVRSLMSNHLTDVLSSDQHTVKPWFAGKLDYSPQVPDLSQQGYVLIGGRLDYIGGRPVAALIYQHRKHYINLFVWPSSPGGEHRASPVAHQGYNLLHWVHGGMTCWVISDVAAADLQEFSRLVEGSS